MIRRVEFSSCENREVVNEVFHVCIITERKRPVKCFLGIFYQDVLNPILEPGRIKIGIGILTNLDNFIHDFFGLAFVGVDCHDDVGSHCSQRLEVGATHFHVHIIPDSTAPVKHKTGKLLGSCKTRGPPEKNSKAIANRGLRSIRTPFEIERQPTL